MQDALLFAILVIVTIIIGLLGYIIGKLSNNSTPTGVQSFFKKNSETDSTTKFSSVSIDEKKIVTNINTSGLEKKYESLGDTTNTNENISTSINKLKTLKG